MASTMHSFRRRAAAALLALSCAWAAGAAPAPPARLSELRHTAWRSDDGAPANIVALAQTPDGFLWLGTGGGLFRFDGVRFEAIVALGGKALLNSSITALYATPSGMLAIGYRFGGLSVFHGQRLDHYSAADGLPVGNAWAFAQGEDGELWAAFTGGVARLRAGAWQAMALDDEPLPYRTMLRDPQGHLWVTAKTGAYVLPRGAAAFVRVAGAPPSFPSLSLAPDGRVWAADFERQRLVPLRQQGASFQAAPEHEHIPFPRSADLHWFDSGGALWMRGDDGVLHLARPGEAQAESFGSAQGLGGSFHAWLQDREGNVWLGTAGGLHRFARANVQRVDLGALGGGVGVAPAEDGAVWAITEAGGLFRVDAAVEAFPQVAPRASHIHRDRRGTVWIGSRDGLWTIEGGQPPVRMARPDLGDDPQGAMFAPIHAMATERSGALWVHLVTRGTFRRVGEQWQRVPEGPGDRIMSMGNDAEGRLWIGYIDRGAARVDGDEMLKFGPRNGLDIGAITALYGRGARVWLGGQRGLALHDGTTMRTLALKGLGELNVVTGIVETASGQLWINAANGLSRIEAAEWQRALADPDHVLQVQRFDAADGLLGSATQIRPLPSLIEADDGRLWAALPTGLFVVDPARLQRNALAPSVIIRGLLADGRHFEPGAAITLPVGRTDLRFDYTATSLTLPQRVQFRYRLEGYDADWQDAGARREAAYTRVGPGDYVFRVIASNSDGVWNETGASMPLRVPPAFWQTSWFAALALAGLGAGLWALVRLRVRQISARLRERLESRLHERERIARELHDTLIQSVTGLTLHVRAAANQVPEGSALRQRLELALTRASELMVEGRDRVTELRLHQHPALPLAALLDRACRDLSDTFPGPDCKLEIQGNARDVNALVAEEVERIAREALSNALRHAGAQSIRVLLHFDRDALRLQLHDDGHGFEEGADATSSRAAHFGIAGMRERAAHIGGQLQIRSGAHGTELLLTVPAATAYLAPARP